MINQKYIKLIFDFNHGYGHDLNLNYLENIVIIQYSHYHSIV